MLTATMAMESVVMSSSANAETKASCRTRSAAWEKASLRRVTSARCAAARPNSLSVGSARSSSPNASVSASMRCHCIRLASLVTRPMR